MALVLGLDIGTTSTIGILADTAGTVRALASRPVSLSSPHPGWAEEDPAEWWANVCALVPELLAEAEVTAGEIAGIGVGGMLPAILLLDAEGRILRPSIQQSDGRSGEEVAALAAEVDASAFLGRTGNGINQQLAAPRLRWIRLHEPDVFARTATVMGSYDWINFRLTGRRAVEQNWALEAGLTDLATHRIADDLVALTGLPRQAVPERIESTALHGRVTAEAARATSLAEGTPVIGGAADFIASALVAGVTAPGDVLLKFGGSVDILTASTTARPDARLFLDYHLIPGVFVPNGCMSTGGSALNWAAATFAAGIEPVGGSRHRALDLLAAAVPAGAEGLTVLPYFLGEKTPLHDPAARGVLEGLTLSHGLGHIWRALLESYAFAIRHHLEVMAGIGHAPRRFLASDGGSRSSVWMQIVADVIGEPVEVPGGHPGTCLGAAWTAAMGIGAASDWADVARFVTRGASYRPDPATREAYEAGYRRFRDLYPRIYRR
ncbi:MAG: FGGY-family carbohydrate kinase [Rhodobacteraceae bacterium]|nr:FGGY-family carbohydrate kinase [Paracoccaceae bacterium]